MPIYKTPGVYVEEITKLPPSVAAVATAIPVFIGYTEKAIDEEGNNLTQKPTRIVSMLEYEKYFGKAKAEEFVVEINETTTPAAIDAIARPPADDYLLHRLYYHLQLYFANGGGPCYITSIGSYANDHNALAYLAAIKELEKYDEPTLIVTAPWANSFESNDSPYSTLADALLQHCAKMKDRFAILDVRANEQGGFKEVIGNDNLKYGAAYTPYLNTNLNVYYDPAVLKIASHKKDGADVAAPNSLKDKTLKELSQPMQDLIYAELAKFYVTNMPPSAAIAGVYAATDATRGVWKAPANVSLRNVTSLTQNISDEDQQNLNVDPVAGKSINAIRAFTGKGIMVWGARTLAGNDNEWRYVPVRRFFNFVEESCQKSTAWAVFEPNDAGTWTRIKAQIENFLNNLWRDGALMGSKPNQAYYVSVGLGTTMTAQDVLEGKLIVEIGLAAVRPAEFVILRFSHLLPQA